MIATNLRPYSRYVLNLPLFLQRRWTLKQARSAVERRLRERHEAFLQLARRAIYEHSVSPYRRLLEAVGCELGDLEAMVRSDGVDECLRRLHGLGVYVDFEEFKGRSAIRRNGLEIRIGPRSFDNPHLRSGYETRSGGSSGPGARVRVDLDHLFARAANRMLGESASGMLGLPTVLWMAGLPGSGLSSILTSIWTDRPPEKWHTPADSFRAGLLHRLANRYTGGVARALGIPFPHAEPLALESAEEIALWMAERARGDAGRSGCVFRGSVSRAVRVAQAARTLGLDLRGARFLVGGEPPTPAKVRLVEATGAEVVATYYVSEVGLVGFGCPEAEDRNDLHLFEDSHAVIARRTRAPHHDAEVEALHFTSLLPSSPKILLNTQTDDYGALRRRSCGCLLGGVGLTGHLEGLRSFGKLNGEGVTVLAGTAVELVERVLPERFGGSMLDYQFVEEETEAGRTRLCLVVAPAIALDRSEDAVEAVLRHLESGGVAARLAAASWREAGALRVQRAAPRWTARGKLLPLRPARSERTVSKGSARTATGSAEAR